MIAELFPHFTIIFSRVTETLIDFFLDAEAKFAVTVVRTTWSAKAQLRTLTQTTDYYLNFLKKKSTRLAAGKREKEKKGKKGKKGKKDYRVLPNTQTTRKP